MTKKATILIIDDDRELLKSCERILNRNNYEVVTLQDSKLARTEIESGKYDLFISDLRMPDVDGMALLRHAKTVRPETPFVIFTAHGSVELAMNAMRQNAFDFIEKPFKVDRLRKVVEKSIAYQKLSSAGNSRPKEDDKFGNIVGKSPAMQNLFEQIRRVSMSDANVTISGESGTGKELVARCIHDCSPRKTKTFVPVNCGAFPESLFESELFGYEKGAFTGANRQKPGLFEYANEGTFFLDEICELSPAMQVKLLRVLQDGKIRRLGGSNLIDVDVRLISASNRSLDDALAAGELREDLYYRLNVISIHLPSLRERAEDIPLLAQHFLEQFAKTKTLNIRGLTEEALILLQTYDWPGNVRQLENVIERAVALVTDEWIRPVDLPPVLRNAQTEKPLPHANTTLKEAKKVLIERFERDYLVQMLRRFKGNISQAARAADVDRRTFHRLINRYDINVDETKN